VFTDSLSGSARTSRGVGACGLGVWIYQNLVGCRRLRCGTSGSTRTSWLVGACGVVRLDLPEPRGLSAPAVWYVWIYQNLVGCRRLRSGTSGSTRTSWGVGAGGLGRGRHVCHNATAPATRSAVAENQPPVHEDHTDQRPVSRLTSVQGPD